MSLYSPPILSEWDKKPKETNCETFKTFLEEPAFNLSKDNFEQQTENFEKKQTISMSNLFEVLNILNTTNRKQQKKSPMNSENNETNTKLNNENEYKFTKQALWRKCHKQQACSKHATSMQQACNKQAAGKQQAAILS